MLSLVKAASTDVSANFAFSQHLIIYLIEAKFKRLLDSDHSYNEFHIYSTSIIEFLDAQLNEVEAFN